MRRATNRLVENDRNDSNDSKRRERVAAELGAVGLAGRAVDGFGHGLGLAMLAGSPSDHPHQRYLFLCLASGALGV
jgi:hypothetical protein